MIFPAMMFLLGFLCAGLLALLILPPVIRSTHRTKNNKRGKIPKNIRQAEADKDRLRAKFAISIRKREHSIEKLKARAQAHLIEIAERNVKIRSMKKEIGKITDLADQRYQDKKELRNQLNHFQSSPIEPEDTPRSASAKESTAQNNIHHLNTNETRSPSPTPKTGPAHKKPARQPGEGALASRIQNLRNSD